MVSLSAAGLLMGASFGVLEPVEVLVGRCQKIQQNFYLTWLGGIIIEEVYMRPQVKPRHPEPKLRKKLRWKRDPDPVERVTPLIWDLHVWRSWRVVPKPSIHHHSSGTAPIFYTGITTRVSQFCQKLKIQKLIPLRCWIGSNGFQKVQKLENLWKTAPTHFFVYEVILLKKIFRRISFCLKTILKVRGNVLFWQNIFFKNLGTLEHL